MGALLSYVAASGGGGSLWEGPYQQWPLTQGLTGTNIVYTTNAVPATYTSASSILNR